MRTLGLLIWILVVLTLSIKCEVDNDRLSFILAELIDLRTQLTDLFKSPSRTLQGQENAEWVVHINRGIAEAEWLANLTNTQFVGPMKGFSYLYVFRSYSPQNHSDVRRIKRSLKERQQSSHILWSELQTTHVRQKRDILSFNDPLFESQWHLNGKDMPGMRIAEAWSQGYTGRGVVLSILDDGVDHSHKDLGSSYDPLASYDLNDNDNDPMPTMDEFNKHGTRCAGEIAMQPNNSLCGVGIAYNSKIGGVRMLDGTINDRIEAEALSLLINHVDILSSSWGPKDNGQTVEGPGKLTQLAFLKGITEGRNGKGTIYVWASGNGGQIDNCVCDGYASSIYTFTVSGTSLSREFPWYAERCASTLTTTFSSGSSKQKKIITIDPQDKCTDDHTGTSAAAPIAAGIIALSLEANPSLTWRDVQHLAVWTSNPVPLFHVPGWQKNGAGLFSSSKFGFGLMDAYEMTKMAKNFKSLSDQQNCTTTFPNFENRTITNNLGVVITFKLNGCKGLDNEINSLEYVQLVVDMDSDARGLLSIWLESPSGMRSQLLHPRLKDNSKEGFKNWPFVSSQFWGEKPAGVWKVHVDQIRGTSNDNPLSILKNITINLLGTKDIPHPELKEYRNITQLPDNNSMFFSSKEDRLDITGIENTIRKIRRSLGTSLSNKSEKNLIAVDRLVRTINRMNSDMGKERQYVHFHYN